MVIVGCLNKLSKFFGFFPELFGSTFSIKTEVTGGVFRAQNIR